MGTTAFGAPEAGSWVTGSPLSGAGTATPGRPRVADVIAHYDLGAERYEKWWSPVILPAAAGLIPWLELDGRSIVLDVGAGTGALASAVRTAAPATVVAVDASAEMLRVAHGQRGIPAVQADAMALPVAAGKADAVVLAYVLFHLPDPVVALKEAARVLRPGGRVATVTWASERIEPAQMVWDEALTDAGVPQGPLRRVDAGLDSREAVDRLLRAAGLVPERVWSEQLRHQWDHESFWIFVSGRSAERLGGIDRHHRSVLLARLRTRLRDLRPEDFLWEGQVICAVAAKPAVPRRYEQEVGRDDSDPALPGMPVACLLPDR
jgi:SAM-dependent methyltransferase